MTLKEVVENWIKTEYAWRLGPNAYSNTLTDLMTKAEENLREVLTGERRLKAAGVSLGCTNFEDKPMPGEEIARKLYKKPTKIMKGSFTGTEHIELPRSKSGKKIIKVGRKNSSIKCNNLLDGF